MDELQIQSKSAPSRHGRVFSGFPSVENKLFGAQRLLPVCLCWPCRVRLIDKGFCPCHQGLMSFCQLPGSPVPHSTLLFFFSSKPDRSLSPSLLFLTPSPAPNTIRPPSSGRHSLVPRCQQARLTTYCLNQSAFFKVTRSSERALISEYHKLSV